MKNIHKDIAIAIPAHNEELSIYRTLTSIKNALNYLSENLPIFVCLSKCSDRTEEEIERFQIDHPKVDVTIIVESNGGKAKALKLLDKEINKKYIIFIDGDSSPKEDSLKELISYSSTILPDKKIVSGNAIDPRFTDKTIQPSGIINSFNHIFWQRSPRNIINGQFFLASKGMVQVLPDNVKLDDVYLSIYYWNQFAKSNNSLLIQGSPTTIKDVIRYQKQIQSGKRQIKNLLKNKIDDLDRKERELYSQFNISILDKRKYYSNISFRNIIIAKMVVGIGKLWGVFSVAKWEQTASSKNIAEA